MTLPICRVEPDAGVAANLGFTRVRTTPAGGVRRV